MVSKRRFSGARYQVRTACGRHKGGVRVKKNIEGTYYSVKWLRFFLYSMGGVMYILCTDFDYNIMVGVLGDL